MALPKRKPDTYHSYLLRLWRTNHQPPLLRVSLRDARTGETYQFASLQQLQEFLNQKVTGSSAQEDPKETADISADTSADTSVDIATDRSVDRSAKKMS